MHTQGLTLTELHIDRAHWASRLVQERDDGLVIYCKAWPVRHGMYLDKTAFTLNWEWQAIHCPNGVVLSFTPGEHMHFQRHM